MCIPQGPKSGNLKEADKFVNGLDDARNKNVIIVVSVMIIVGTSLPFG